MNLKNISNIELTSRLDKLVRTERKISHLILKHIVEFESRSIYAEYGCGNMFSYLTKKLGYSEDSAYRRLKAARVLKRIPETAIKIESGALSLTQLTQVEKCLMGERKQGVVRSTNETKQILEKLENCTSFQTQKILAVEFNQPLQVQTRICPQKDESIRLEITLTQEQFNELKTAQSLLSHICHSSDLAEVIATLALKFNQAKLGKMNALKNNEATTSDAFQKTSVENAPNENSDMSRTLKTPTVSGVTRHQELTLISETKQLTQSFLGARKSKRKYISIETRRSLLKQAEHSCEYTSSSGARCDSQYQLQIDHIKPVALGGTNSKENLKILCRAHNIFEAQRLGLKRKPQSQSNINKIQTAASSSG